MEEHNNNIRYHLLMIFISLCLLWASSHSAKAQATDTVIFKKSQLVETINWTTYQSEKRKQPSQTILKLNAGFGTRPEKEPLNEDFPKDFSKLKNGFVWDVSSDFIFSNDIGVRLTFYQFRSSYHSPNTDQQGSFTIKDRITYVGPAFVIRIPFDQSPWDFDASVGFGYIEYREKQTFAIDNANFFGATISVQFSMGVEYKITPQWGIGINVQTIIGEITEFRHEKNGEKWTATFEAGEGEDIAQTGMGIGIRYYFK